MIHNVALPVARFLDFEEVDGQEAELREHIAKYLLYELGFLEKISGLSSVRLVWNGLPFPRYH